MADPKDMTSEQFEKGQKIFSEIVAKYYGDPDFKARVDSNPTQVLKEEGMELPDGTEVELLFNTQDLVHIVLPTTD